MAEGKTFVAPYDDPLTIAGQGTVGTEILRQISTAQLANLHAIFVPVGGGGLIAGIAAYVKALYPQVGRLTQGSVTWCRASAPRLSAVGAVIMSLPCPVQA